MHSLERKEIFCYFVANIQLFIHLVILYVIIYTAHSWKVTDKSDVYIFIYFIFMLYMYKFKPSIFKADTLNEKFGGSHAKPAKDRYYQNQDIITIGFIEEWGWFIGPVTKGRHSVDDVTTWSNGIQVPKWLRQIQ